MSADLASVFLRGPRRWTVLALLLLGLVVRVPGVYWGSNFPIDGMGLHHPDELTQWVLAKNMLRRAETAATLPLYPRGTAAPVAVAVAAFHAVTKATPSRESIIRAGRALSVVYGAMTVLVVLLLGHRFLAQWSSVVAAGVATALGGLHVTQSHFFVADAPTIFWFTLGLYLLRLHLDDESGAEVEHFQWSAFAFGVAFGAKLHVVGLASLGCAALLPGPRPKRVAGAAVFFGAGFAFVTAFTYSPLEIRETLLHGVNAPMLVDRVSGALVYVTELAGVFGLPVVLLAVVGAVAFARRSALLFRGSQHRVAAALTVWLPVAVAVYVILFRLDPFPRHLLTLLPWFALFAGAGFSLVQGRVRRFGAPPWVLPVLATTWLALLVIDAERNFVTDPRNRAAAWLLANVPRGTVTYWPHHLLPSYPHANFSNGATPEVIVMDMLFANDYLSGQGWRNSMPTDYRRVFGGHNQARLERVQSLFRGTSGYREMARFTEGYFMPELRLPLRLVGDRSRSYLTEVIIFKRDSAAIGASEASRRPDSASVAAPVGAAPRSGTPPQ